MVLTCSRTLLVLHTSGRWRLILFTVLFLMSDNEISEIIYSLFRGGQNIFLTIFITKFVVKCATKILKIG